jgi:hypothetical protein
MNVTAVESTTLAALAYDDARRTMRLEFRSRAVYSYFGVPRSVYEALLADTLAQEVVNTWGLHTQAGNAKVLTPEFLDIFEKACRYQEAKTAADFFQSRNALSESGAETEEAARRTFIEADKPWAEKHRS